MKILGIESASITASCAISEDEILLCEYTQNHKKTHSEKLMPLIVKALEDNEISLNDIDVIAISKGPGSYTGLRIGAAIAKGLAQALDIPMVAVPTMKALAANVFDSSRYIIPILDAKGGRAYSGIYKWENNNLVTVKEQFPINIDELVDIINGLDNDVVLNGDGSVNYKEVLQSKINKKIYFAPEKYNILSASSINHVGYQLIKENNMLSCYDFSPEYLRPSQAERMCDIK